MHIHSNPHTLVLISRGLANKVQTLVLTLNLIQEPKNAMRPREVRLQKDRVGEGSTSSGFRRISYAGGQDAFLVIRGWQGQAPT